MDRRSRLIAELLRLEEAHRSPAPVGRTELDRAMRALAEEVGEAERHCLRRLDELGAELDRRRGGGTATGLRDGANGQLLGHG